MEQNKIVVKQVEVNSLFLKSKQQGYDFVVNPYTGCPFPCKYCYASFIRRFSRHKEPWGEFLDVKHCDKKQNLSQLEGKRVLISSVTEPYNIYEKKYKATRNILKMLQPIDCQISIFTKSSLVLRDLDVLKQLKDVEVAISLSLPNTIASQLEPSYPVEMRINALKTLHSQGIKTAVVLSPIFPELTDVDGIISQTKPFADRYIFESLTLRNEFKPAVLNYIWKNFPQLYPQYNKIYRENDDTYFVQLFDRLSKYCQQQGIDYEIIKK